VNPKQVKRRTVRNYCIFLEECQWHHFPVCKWFLYCLRTTGIITFLSEIWEWVSCLSRYHLVSYCGCRRWSDAAVGLSSSLAFRSSFKQSAN
jgi:hypothetical protein